MSEKLHIIDALGPFFINESKQSVINWSKVPFSDIETNSRLTKQNRSLIVENFKTFTTKIAALGYNAISIDDLAHLVRFDFYDHNTQALLSDYRTLYSQLFNIAKATNLRIYVNTDYLFSHRDIERYLETENTTHQDFFILVLKQAFKTFPQIDGIILRMGENDGKDVQGTFLSKLMLRTPKSANKLLRAILPLFEQSHKQLLFRTWSVGAYKIGDLIWNKDTYDAIFGSIDSDALIISMKFGDTDFMRHLTLNPLLLHGTHKKILELQTRREWEGMGNIPSFVGWDYERYLHKLQNSENFVGIHAWCQTGGWAKREWSNLTYLKGSSFWNELNTEVTISLAQPGASVEDAIKAFCMARNISDYQKFIELLHQSEISIKKGMYVSELAQKTLYFRRTRIPPLLWITWDKVHLPSAVVHLHRILIADKQAFIQDSDEAITASIRMFMLAKELQLDKRTIQSIQFLKDTLSIFAALRRYIAEQLDEEGINQLNNKIDLYQQTYPEHYLIEPLRLVKKRRLPKKLLSVAVRNSANYRKHDKVILKTSRMQAQLLRIYLKKSRSHLANQSMGIETLFK